MESLKIRDYTIKWIGEESKGMNPVASLDPFISGFLIFLGSDMKGSSEIDRGFGGFWVLAAVVRPRGFGREGSDRANGQWNGSEFTFG